MKRLVVMVLGLALGSCQADLSAPARPIALDKAYFRCRVQPVLTRSCATFACHGDARRYFHVFARNRLRAGGEESERNSALSELERNDNYLSAKAMVGTDGPRTSFFLQKPLESSAGGYFHKGAEIFGDGNVFATADDPDYRTLRTWVEGASEDNNCIEPGSDK